ncbi:MAG: hypothetical protein ACJARR_003819 [Pseudophaeobacter arcticus]
MRSFALQSFRENLRLVALVVGIAVGGAAQFACLTEVGQERLAKSEEALPHWAVSPVTVDRLAPVQG